MGLQLPQRRLDRQVRGDVMNRHQILVTGATGFIGWHVLQALQQRGDEITCLRRAASDVSRYAGADIRWVVGDVTQPETLPTALHGVDVVYHLAGATAALGRRGYFHVNEGGTRHLLAACASQSQPPIVVVVSSLAAVGPTCNGRPLDAAEPLRPVSQYGRSKRAAELAAHQFADRVPVTVIRPPLVFGPWDKCVLKIFRPISRFGVHWTPSFATRRLSVVHAADLAEALVLAARVGRRLSPLHGQGYYTVACEERPTYAELGRRMAAALGCRTVVVRTPSAVTWTVAGAAEVLARLRRRPAIFSWDKAREAVAGDWTCSAELATRELGWRCGADLDTRLRETVDWYRERGWL
jgi:nucleoside-diphosphate-sugar epimerase